MSGNRLIFTIIFVLVFVLMVSIGMIAGVSLGAGLKRALLAAVFFTAVSFGTSVVIDRYVINDIKPTGNSEDEGDILPENENTGQMLDITISESLQETGEDIQESSGISDEGTFNQEINPLVTRQIDPNVEKVINNDPKRMADIIKKMGFKE